MSKIYLKPLKAEDGVTVLPVINPETGKPLPEEGAEVSPSPYWRRRLIDKEVEHVTKAEQLKPAQPKSGKKGE